MITVAVVAILAMLVVPSWMGEGRKGKARSEAAAMFAELVTKELQYKVDNANFLDAATCPAGPPTAQVMDAKPCVAVGGPWEPLRVILPEQEVYCTYTITTGTSAQT